MTSSRYTNADKKFTSMLFKKYYPEDYLKLHGNQILTKEFVVTTLTRKDKLAKAKEFKIPYFNSMNANELGLAIEYCVAEKKELLQAIVSEAKARFWKHRKKYNLGKKTEAVV